MAIAGPKSFPQDANKVKGRMMPVETSVIDHLRGPHIEVPLGEKLVGFMSAPDQESAQIAAADLSNDINEMTTRSGRFPGDRRHGLFIDRTGRALWTRLGNVLRDVWGTKPAASAIEDAVVIDTKAKMDTVQFLKAGIEDTKGKDILKKVGHYLVLGSLSAITLTAAIGAGFTPAGLFLLAGGGLITAITYFKGLRAFRERDWTRSAATAVANESERKLMEEAAAERRKAKEREAEEGDTEEADVAAQTPPPTGDAPKKKVYKTRKPQGKRPNKRGYRSNRAPGDVTGSNGDPLHPTPGVTQTTGASEADDREPGRDPGDDTLKHSEIYS
jgi:hypothetical protein